MRERKGRVTFCRVESLTRSNGREETGFSGLYRKRTTSKTGIHLGECSTKREKPQLRLSPQTTKHPKGEVVGLSKSTPRTTIMLQVQRKKWMGVRLPIPLLSEMETFLPRFRKSGGEKSTLSDIIRVGLEFAMRNKASLLRRVA